MSLLDHPFAALGRAGKRTQVNRTREAKEEKNERNSVIALISKDPRHA